MHVFLAFLYRLFNYSYHSEFFNCREISTQQNGNTKHFRKKQKQKTFITKMLGGGETK